MKVRCPPFFKNLTSVLHLLAIFSAIAGTTYQSIEISKGNMYSYWLPLSLAIALLLRIPNQVCLAFIDRDGWLSVFGTLTGAVAYIVMTFLIIQQQKEISEARSEYPGYPEN